MDTNVTSRKRGRPPGQYEYKVSFLLDIIKVDGSCRDTDRKLADRVGVGTRQVARYIRSLKERGLIEVQAKRYNLEGGWSNDRVLTLSKESR